MKVPVNRPLLDGNESKYLQECIDTGWISSEGPFVNRFESEFAKKVGREFGVAVSSGTAALDIAIELLDLQVGDEVIIPAFTIISCVHQIMRRGATPVLIDSDPASWNMDTSLIEARITNRTKAILVVHIYGLPVNMAEVERIAKQHKLFVIEDAAEAHGLMFDNRPCGSFGDISIFSFYPNKHITTGEGGMLVCNDEHLAEKCKKLRNLAFEPQGRRFIHHELGWNYRMTNLQAALGVAQLEKMEYHIQRKREIGKLYTQGLKDVKGFQLPLDKTDYAQNIYWVFGLVAGSEEQQEAMVKKLGEAKIGTRPFFWCMHEQPVFKKMGLFENESYPVAEKLARNGFYIPSGLGLSDGDITKVINTII